MTEIFENILWLLLVLGPLLLLQRWLHREIQGILLLITHRTDITMAIFSILFLPGVLLHEFSHFLVARLLGVKTGRLSVIPRPVDKGKIQLGYVETVKSDLIRDSLIGAAPLFAGSAFVALAGLYGLRLDSIHVNQIELNIGYLIDNLEMIYNRPDFWLWFYLIFTISSTMLPSASDRRAWLPLLVLIFVLCATAFILGAGPLLFDRLLGPFAFIIRSMIFVISLSVVVHSILMLPAWISRHILERLTGYVIN